MGAGVDEVPPAGVVIPGPAGAGPRRRGQQVATAGRAFATGVLMLVKGLRMYATSPRLMLLGMIPAVITGVMLTGAIIALILVAGDLAGWLTWFAEGWGDGPRTAVRIAAAIVVVGLGLLLSVLTFTALTLTVGQPFYETISKRVDDQAGGVPDEVDVSFWRSLPRSIADSARTLALSVLIGVPLALAGCIPVVGGTVVPVVAACVGGWFLVVELTAVPFERRGLRLADRRRILRGHRALGLGFGVATFACFLVPMGAVVVMPAATAGATLLTRQVLAGSDD